MNKYTFRLDVIPDVGDIETRIGQALEPFDKYAVAFEISAKVKKQHYQGIIFTEWKHVTYKKFMEKLFPEWKGTRGTGSGSKRSFAPCTEPEKYESYVLKDGDVCFIKGYSESDIKAIPKWLPKEEFFKENKKKEIPWFQRLISHAKQRGCNASTSGWELAASIIDFYRINAKNEPQDFQIRCYAKSIQREMVYEQCKESGNMQVYENYLKSRAKDVIGCVWTHVDI